MKRALAVAVVIVGFARAAAAQEPSRAEALFDEGKQLVEAHRFAEACPKLAESNRIDPELGTLLWLGGCYEKLGQSAAAWRSFDAAATIAHEKSDERESVAREHLGRLDAAVFKLTVDAPGARAELVVQLDGAVLPRASWGKEMVLEPGPHVVTAGQWIDNLDGVAGASRKVVVPALPNPRAGWEWERPPPPLPFASNAGWRIAGWTLVAVGAVGGVALGAGFGLDAKSKNDASNAPPHNCAGSLCDDQSGVDLRQHALDSALVSTIAFAVGGAVLAAGVLMVILSPSSHKSSVHVGLSPAAVSFGGAF